MLSEDLTAALWTRPVVIVEKGMSPLECFGLKAKERRRDKT